MAVAPTLAKGFDEMAVHGLYGSSRPHNCQSSVRMSDMRPDSLGSSGEIESLSFDSVLAESVL